MLPCVRIVFGKTSTVLQQCLPSLGSRIWFPRSLFAVYRRIFAVKRYPTEPYQYYTLPGSRFVTCAQLFTPRRKTLEGALFGLSSSSSPEYVDKELASRVHAAFYAPSAENTGPQTKELLLLKTADMRFTHAGLHI